MADATIQISDLRRAELRLTLAELANAEKDIQIATLTAELAKANATEKIRSIRRELGLDDSWLLDIGSFTFISQ